jgi:hypothetical protein
MKRRIEVKKNGKGLFGGYYDNGKLIVIDKEYLPKVRENFFYECEIEEKDTFCVAKNLTDALTTSVDFTDGVFNVVKKNKNTGVVIDITTVEPKKVEETILCTGKKIQKITFYTVPAGLVAYLKKRNIMGKPETLWEAQKFDDSEIEYLKIHYPNVNISSFIELCEKQKVKTTLLEDFKKRGSVFTSLIQKLKTQEELQQQYETIIETLKETITKVHQKVDEEIKNVIGEIKSFNDNQTPTEVGKQYVKINYFFQNNYFNIDVCRVVDEYVVVTEKEYGMVKLGATSVQKRDRMVKRLKEFKHPQYLKIKSRVDLINNIIKDTQVIIKTIKNKQTEWENKKPKLSEDEFKMLSEIIFPLYNEKYYGGKIKYYDDIKLETVKICSL